jgi:hypothetical protein
MQSARKAGKTSAAVTHTLRCSDRRYLTLRLTRKLAIAAHCTECLGFEDNPVNCTSLFCPLFPFRAKTLRTKTGNTEKPT